MANKPLELWDFAFCHRDRSLEVGQSTVVLSLGCTKEFSEKREAGKLLMSRCPINEFAFDLSPLIYFLAQAS